MGAIMGNIVPTAIATPTITILMAIIHVPTTIIPLSGGTKVMRNGALRKKAAAVGTAVAVAAVVVGTAVVVAVVGSAVVVTAVAVAAGRTAIIDLVLASSGSSPAPR